MDLAGNEVGHSGDFCKFDINHLGNVKVNYQFYKNYTAKKISKKGKIVK